MKVKFSPRAEDPEVELVQSINKTMEVAKKLKQVKQHRFPEWLGAKKDSSSITKHNLKKYKFNCKQGCRALRIEAKVKCDQKNNCQIIGFV